MIPSVIISAGLLISGFKCAVIQAYESKTEDYIIESKSEENSEKFYNVESGDFYKFFNDFVRNVHPSLFMNRSKVSTHALDNMIDSVSKIGAVMDQHTLQYCVDLDARFSSGASSQQNLEDSCKIFWTNTGLFSYSIYDEKLDEWTFFDTSDSKQDTEESKESTSSSKNKKKKKKKNKTESLDSTSPKPVATFYQPKMSAIRESLEHNLCQKAMTISMFVLSPEEVAELFRNAPVELVDNPEILVKIEDFSEFKDPESVDKLVQLFTIGAIFATQHQLTASMVKTLPIDALHKLIEARNFDLSSKEVLLLQNRLMFEFQEPFLSDHRTFRLFCAENPVFFFPPASFIFKDQPLDGEIDSNVIESIMAYYVRSESAINQQTLNLFNLYRSMISGNIKSLEFESSALVLVNDLINIFTERSLLIKFMRSDREIDTLIGEIPLVQIYHRIARLFEIPTNGLYRFMLIAEKSSQSTLNNYPMGLEWKAVFVEKLNDQISISIEFKNLLETLYKSISYDVSKPVKVEEINEYWSSIVSRVTSSKFQSGRWNRNFLNFLLTSIHPSELVCLKQDFIERTSVLLSVYPGMRSLNISFIDTNILTDHAWFTSPIKRALFKEIRHGYYHQRFVSSYEVIRDLRRIFSKMDFSSESVVSALWNNSIAAVALNLYPFCLSQNNINELMSCDDGVDFLKDNPSILSRLPSYSNFTFDDIEYLNLRLDGFISHAYTFNAAVVQEWLEDQEYLVNSRSRIFLRYDPAVLRDNPNSWQLVSFEGLHNYKDDAKVLSRVPNSSIDFTAAFENETTLCGKLSLIARALIHIETEISISWLITDFFGITHVGKPSYILAGLITSKRFIIPKLEAMIKDPKLSEDQKKDVNVALELLQNVQISTFKFLFGSRINANNEKDLYDYTEIVRNNESSCELIRKGHGSEKFKRVWCARARLLVLFDIKKNLKSCDDLDELIHRGLLPATDVIFFWLMRNYKNIRKGKIILNTLAQKGEKLEFPLEYTQLPDFDYIKCFLSAI